MTKLHIKKGDTVKVLTGNDKGATGEVLQVMPKEGKAIVEGVNIKTKHRKPTTANPEGGIEKIPAPLLASKLMVVDKDGNATRIGRKKDDSGKLRRYSKKSGEFID
ncbi:MAG: 50S ribosomal protein L24 [Bacteroidia bacterium]